MSVKSAETAFRILKRLAVETRPVSAPELAKTLSVPVTTAARALATIEAAGYAERHQDKARYVIGQSARTLAFAFMAQFPIRDLAMPYLQRLTLETGHTSSLFVRLGWYSVRIASISGPTLVTHNSPLGDARALVDGAPSLAILAHLSEAEFAAALARATITAATREDILRRCAGIRDDGFCLATNLGEPEASDMAVALFDVDGCVIGAVAIEGIPSATASTVARPDGIARQIIQDLSAQASAEVAIALTHYGHVDPDEINLTPVSL